MAKNGCKDTKRSTPPKRNLRFQQLLDKARSGNDTTIHDLWAEFQFDFHGEDSVHE